MGYTQIGSVQFGEHINEFFRACAICEYSKFKYSRVELIYKFLYLKNTDKLLEGINSARNILLFPKKRLISELQNQKNMVTLSSNNSIN
jgi:hypothetical protein